MMNEPEIEVASETIRIRSKSDLLQVGLRSIIIVSATLCKFTAGSDHYDCEDGAGVVIE